MIGGGGEQLTLRVVARTPTSGIRPAADPETFRHKIQVLREHCAAVGRDPSEIELSVQARPNYDDLPATVEALKPLIEAGATHIVLTLPAPFPDGVVARLADEVVAKVG